jgi:Zn-finger nucleic acid-binding protein
MLQCPKCAAEMQTVEYEGVQVDRCTGCKGIWFDILEHEDLKSISGSESIDIGSVEMGKLQDGNNRINCPVCKVPMIRMVVSAQPHINYEACTVCYGIYLDAGEFTDFREETFLESWNSVFGKGRVDKEGRLE